MAAEILDGVDEERQGGTVAVEVFGFGAGKKGQGIFRDAVGGGKAGGKLDPIGVGIPKCAKIIDGRYAERITNVGELFETVEKIV